MSSELIQWNFLSWFIQAWLLHDLVCLSNWWGELTLKFNLIRIPTRQQQFNSQTFLNPNHMTDSTFWTNPWTLLLWGRQGKVKTWGTSFCFWLWKGRISWDKSCCSGLKMDLILLMVILILRMQFKLKIFPFLLRASPDKQNRPARVVSLSRF